MTRMPRLGWTLAFAPLITPLMLLYRVFSLFYYPSNLTLPLFFYTSSSNRIALPSLGL